MVVQDNQILCKICLQRSCKSCSLYFQIIYCANSCVMSLSVVTLGGIIIQGVMGSEPASLLAEPKLNLSHNTACRMLTPWHKLHLV